MAEVGAVYVKIIVQMDDFDRQMKRAEQKVKQLDGRQIRLNVQGAVKGLQGLSDAFKAPTDAYNNLIEGLGRMGDRLTSWGMDLASFGYRMMIATSPLAAAGLASLQMATDLDTSMALVATQLDLRGEDLALFIDKFTKGFVDLSTEIPIAAKDMGDALYYLVSSMTIDPEIAAQFIEPISKAAVAGQATAQMVAESITPILNVYQDLARTSEGVEHVLDVLFLTVKKGRGEFSDIAVQVGDFIQIAEQAGASFEEAMAAFAMATRVTTPAQAATWMANVYRSLVRPDAAEALGDIGIAIEEIVEGTGQWVTVTKTSEKTQDKATGLTEKHARAIEELKEATLLYNEAIAKSESTWDDYTGSVRTSLEQGSRVEGVSRQGINALQRYERAQRNLMKIEADLAEVTGELTETHTKWTGELVRRPTLDIITDLAKYISTLSSEQEKLNVVWDVFPRMRGMQGAILFIENLAEIVEWEEEFTEATGLTQEAFEIMMGTFESKIGVLKNMFLALGFDLLEEYQDDIKNVIDALTKLFGAFRELPTDVKSKVAMISGLLLLAGPAALVGSVLMMGGGMLISLIASLASLPSLVMLTGLGVLLGDKMPTFLEALGAYGGGVSGFATAIADLAVHFGILSEADAIGILEALGITVGEFDDEKVDRIAEGLEGIAGAISGGIDDLKEWQEAFGLFLKDVEEREGAVGTLVRYLERLWDIIKEAAGLAAPMLGFPEGMTYEEMGPEEKAGFIDRAMGFLIGTKLASWILAGLAQTLGALFSVKMLLALNIMGSGAGGVAAAGSAVATAGFTIGSALAAAMGVGLLYGVGQWAEKRFPEDIKIGMFEIPAETFVPGYPVMKAIKESILSIWERVSAWLQTDFFGEPRWVAARRLIREGMDAIWEEIFDYPEEAPVSEYWANLVDPWKERGALGFLRAGQATHPDEVGPPEEYDTMIRALMTGEGIEEAIAIAESHLAAHLNALLPEMRDTVRDPYPGEPWRNVAAVRGFEAVLEALGPAIVTPFEQADREIQVILNRWGGKFDDIARDREPRIKPIFHDEEKLNRWIKDFRWLEGRHESIWHITEYIQRRYKGAPTHLGGYPMHEGGYPSLNMPNLLASEFVMSPRTTQVLENYLGRLDQQKVRSAVTHAPVGMTINFFKGSVTSKEDAEQAADIIYDRIADRAGGLSLTEI